MIPNNARHLRLTAAAGTELAVASSGAPQLPRLLDAVAWQPPSGLHPEGLHPTRGVAGSGFRPLPNTRYCSLP